MGYEPESLSRLQARAFRADDEETIAGWVSKNRLSANVADVSTDSRFIRIDPDLASGVWVPIQHEGKLLGVLSVKSTRVNAFTRDDERLLILFANQVSVAMENARLFEVEKQRRETARALLDVALASGTNLDLKETLHQIAVHSAKACNVARCTIFLLDETGKRLMPIMSQFSNGHPDERQWELFRQQDHSHKIKLISP